MIEQCEQLLLLGTIAGSDGHETVLFTYNFKHFLLTIFQLKKLANLIIVN